MKAEQRAELLKRIKDQQGKKLSFQECREIAKDLNLSLEQVKQIAWFTCVFFVPFIIFF